MTSTNSWHINKWPPLAWLETGLKLVALGIGMETAVSVFTVAAITFPAGLRLVQFIILAILSFGLIAAIVDRLADKEIIAMVFVILNNLGHWGLVLGLASTLATANRVWLFAGFMLLGDLAKLWFIKAEKFTVRDFPQRTLYSLTLVYVLGYGVLLLLQWLQ